MAVIEAREQERLEARATDAKHALEQFEKSKKRKGEAEANDELEAAEAVRANIDNIVLEDVLYTVDGRKKGLIASCFSRTAQEHAWRRWLSLPVFPALWLQ
jgi:hypothetical protein